MSQKPNYMVSAGFSGVFHPNDVPCAGGMSDAVRSCVNIDGGLYQRTCEMLADIHGRVNRSWDMFVFG